MFVPERISLSLKSQQRFSDILISWAGLNLGKYIQAVSVMLRTEMYDEISELKSLN